MTPATPRVFHLDDGRLWRGGQHQVWLLMRELAARGVAQRLLGREGSPLTIRARQLGIEVEPIASWGELDWRSPRRIAALARAFEANLLHAHTAHAHTCGLRAARRMTGVQLVTTRRVDFPIDRNFWSRRKYRAPGQHFIAISAGVRNVLLEGGVAPERIDTVASGVPPIDAERAQPRDAVRDAFGIAENEIAIVNVGALTDHKGQRWLIDAAPAIVQAFPSARIHLLGEGELRKPLEEQIRRLGLERHMILHGYVEDARLKLAGFDLFVSSSHLEGLGTAILDAMLAGLPVVAAAAGGVPDVVRNGQTGRLVPPRDATALAGGIVAALSDPESSRRMADAALAFVQAHFSAQSMAEGVLAVYRKLLDRPA